MDYDKLLSNFSAAFIQPKFAILPNLVFTVRKVNNSHTTV